MLIRIIGSVANLMHRYHRLSRMRVESHPAEIGRWAHVSSAQEKHGGIFK
jgi:hypothetical protein